MMLKESTEYNGIWFHGHSGNTPLKELHVINCSHPFFLASNLEYAMQFAAMEFDPDKGYTDHQISLKNDCSDAEILAVKLSDRIRIFDFQKNANRLNSIWGKGFNVLAQKLNYNIDALIYGINQVVDDLQAICMEDPECGLNLSDLFDIGIDRFIERFEEYVKSIEKPDNTGFGESWCTSWLIEKYDDIGKLFIEFTYEFIKYNKLDVHHKKFVQNDAYDFGNDDWRLTVLRWKNVVAKAYGNIVKVTGCNAMTSFEVTNRNVGSGVEKLVDCGKGMVVFDVDAIDQVYMKIMDFRQAEEFVENNKIEIERIEDMKGRNAISTKRNT